MMTEICQNRNVDFATCAPNLRIDINNLRQTWLSQMGHIAASSRICQAVETTGNSQLIWDDAIYFDHGTRMGLLMFDEVVETMLPEPSIEECQAVRMQNLIKRTRSDGKKTSIKKHLNQTMTQMAECSNVREAERASPRVEFAQDTGLAKLSLGL